MIFILIVGFVDRQGVHLCMADERNECEPIDDLIENAESDLGSTWRSHINLEGTNPDSANAAALEELKKLLDLEELGGTVDVDAAMVKQLLEIIQSKHPRSMGLACDLLRRLATKPVLREVFDDERCAVATLLTDDAFPNYVKAAILQIVVLLLSDSTTSANFVGRDSPIRCAAVTVQLQQTITEAEASDDCKVLELACIVVSRCIQISQDVKEGEPAALASALQKATQEPVACAAVVAMGMAASAVASGWSGVAADCRMGGHTLVAVLLCSLPLVLAEPKTADRAVTCLYGACLAVKAEDEMQIDLALLLQHALGASAQLQEKLLGAFAHVCQRLRITVSKDAIKQIVQLAERCTDPSVVVACCDCVLASRNYAFAVECGLLSVLVNSMPMMRNSEHLDGVLSCIAKLVGSAPTTVGQLLQTIGFSTKLLLHVSSVTLPVRSLCWAAYLVSAAMPNGISPDALLLASNPYAHSVFDSLKAAPPDEIPLNENQVAQATEFWDSLVEASTREREESARKEAKLRDHLSTLLAQLDATRGELSDKESALQSLSLDKTKLAKTLESLQGEKDSIQKQLVAMREVCENASSQLAMTKRHCSDLEKEVLAATARAGDLAESKEAELRDHLSTLSENLQRLQHENEILRKRCSGLEEDLVLATTVSAESTHKEAELLAQLDATRTELSSKESALRSLSDVLAATDRSNQDMKAELMQKSEEVRQLQGQVQDSVVTLNKLSAEKKEAEDLRTKNHILVTQCDALERENTKIAQQLHEVQKKQQDLSEEVNRLRSELAVASNSEHDKFTTEVEPSTGLVATERDLQSLSPQRPLEERQHLAAIPLSSLAQGTEIDPPAAAQRLRPATQHNTNALALPPRHFDATEGIALMKQLMDADECAAALHRLRPSHNPKDRYIQRLLSALSALCKVAQAPHTVAAADNSPAASRQEGNSSIEEAFRVALEAQREDAASEIAVLQVKVQQLQSELRDASGHSTCVFMPAPPPLSPRGPATPRPAPRADRAQSAKHPNDNATTFSVRPIPIGEGPLSTFNIAGDRHLRSFWAHRRVPPENGAAYRRSGY